MNDITPRLEGIQEREGIDMSAVWETATLLRHECMDKTRALRSIDCWSPNGVWVVDLDCRRRGEKRVECGNVSNIPRILVQVLAECLPAIPSKPALRLYEVRWYPYIRNKLCLQVTVQNSVGLPQRHFCYIGTHRTKQEMEALCDRLETENTEAIKAYHSEWSAIVAGKIPGTPEYKG